MEFEKIDEDIQFYLNDVSRPVAIARDEAKDKRKPGKYRSMGFQESDSLMIVANLDGYIEDVNEVTKELFGLPRDFFVGKRSIDFYNLIFGEMTNYYKHRQLVIDEGYGEVIQPFIGLSKEVRYYKINAFFDKDCDLFLVRIIDYTEQVLLKQDMAHKGSLSEVGQLAASIAHEIRNPMTTLKGFTQLLKENAEEDALKYLTVIDDEILRIESILSEMLVLAKPRIMEKKYVSARKLLADIIHIIHPKATFEGIEIVQRGEYASDASIYGEEGKLKQVLLNLLKNALESMEPGGILTITMENGANNQLKLMIEDTGKGMIDTQLSQIFSPYFTTRSDGTGLGLPFVLKTVENHGGTITVSSKVGHGSRFVLSLPVCEGDMDVEDLLKESICVN